MSVEATLRVDELHKIQGGSEGPETANTQQVREESCQHKTHRLVNEEHQC